MNSKSFLSAFAMIAAMVVLADPNNPQITLGAVTQDPATHLVKATYMLDEPAVITFDVKTNGVSIGGANLTHAYGDVHRVVEAGSHTLYWQANNAWPGHRPQSATFEVVAWATNSPPDYMVINLMGNFKGTRTYYIAPEQLPGEGGVTNKMYKTDFLVMRRIPAKDVIFPMGLRWYEGWHVYHRVKLTNDFYMAIYELTRGQYANVRGSQSSISWFGTKDGAENPDYTDAQREWYESNPALPVPQTRYTTFRGTTKLWQTDGHDIDSGCELQTFRTVLKIPTLDLPTDAEWEFACRAGTAGDRYDGTGSGTSPDAIAWVNINTPKQAGGTRPMPQEVGLLKPNQFGLYDILGNVPEVCLDYANQGSSYAIANQALDGEPAIAPTGASTDVNGNTGSSAIHVHRGGGVLNDQYSAVAWVRSYNQYAASYNHPVFGFRLVCLP